MDIVLTFHLAGGWSVTHNTPEFASVDQAETTIRSFIGDPNSTLTLHRNDGTKRVISGRHVTSVAVDPGPEG